MSQTPFSGVVYTSSQGELTGLPLDKVIVDALIVDRFSRVDIIQRFYNPSTDATSRAKYVFPVPARAAICGFEMHTAEGKVLVGKAKEKLHARNEHDKALRDGKQTALLDWASDDVFVCSIGSVAGKESIVIVTTYVMDLMDGDVETQVRFYVPVAVGQRYGSPPPGVEDASAATSQTRVRFNVNIQMPGMIKKVESPSHEDHLVVQPYKTHSGKDCKRRIVAKLRSNEYLTQDFVLLIDAATLDTSRCLVEYYPQSITRGSMAMQLTLLPNFELPPPSAKEFIFLIDRSGSMAGARIETAKRGLAMLLRILPSQGTIFNVFGFGSECYGCWGHSKSYSQLSLTEMASHVAAMEANMGGTEIHKALRTTLASRSPNVPTAVIVLTDGNVSQGEVDQARILVKNAVAQSHSNAPLTVFVLGIGEQVSTSLCQGIAEAGNGVCLWATAAESIVDKCATLVQAGSTFTLQHISIDWGLPPHVLQSGQPDLATAFLSKDQVLLQSPSVLPALHPNTRLTVFALIQGEHLKLPETVTLHAKRDGSGPPLTFDIPIKQVKFETENIHTQLLHTLAAKQIINELQDLLIVKGGPSDAEIKPSIIALAERYQLASRFTSFVTEDVADPDLDFPLSSQSLRAIRHRHMSAKLSQLSMLPRRGQPNNSLLQTAIGYATTFGSTLLRSWARSSTHAHVSSVVTGGHLPTMPGHLRSNDHDSIASQDSVYGDVNNRDPNQNELNDGGYESDGTFTTISSLLSSVSSSLNTEDSRPSSPSEEHARSASPIIDTRNDHFPSTMGLPSRLPSPPPPQLEHQVSELIGVMHYDGSFADDGCLETIIGRSAIDEGRDLPVDLWVSVLALAYLKRYLRSNRGLLEPVIEKVTQYVNAKSQSCPSLTVEQLLEKASAALSR